MVTNSRENIEIYYLSGILPPFFHPLSFLLWNTLQDSSVSFFKWKSVCCYDNLLASYTYI